MNETKSWYLSRTIWASIAGTALALAGWMGLRTGLVDAGLLTDQLAELAAAIAGILAIVGRLRATTRIG